MQFGSDLCLLSVKRFGDIKFVNQKSNALVVL